MDVDLFLCKKCYKKAKQKFMIYLLIGLLLMIIGGILLGVIEFEEGGFGGLIILSVGVFIFIYSIGTKNKFTNYFFNVNLHSNQPKLNFKSKQFANDYLALNGTFELKT